MDPHKSPAMMLLLNSDIMFVIDDKNTSYQGILLRQSASNILKNSHIHNIQCHKNYRTDLHENIASYQFLPEEGL